jgi:hypothetical protein
MNERNHAWLLRVADMVDRLLGDGWKLTIELDHIDCKHPDVKTTGDAEQRLNRLGVTTGG